MQTNKQANEKATKFSSLLAHTVNYAWVMTIIIGFYELFIMNGNSMRWFVFGFVTFVAHTVTDYFTSKINKKLAPKEYKVDINFKEYVCFPEGRNYHNFFVGVGFDQTIHYITLLLTLYFLYA